MRDCGTIALLSAHTPLIVSLDGHSLDTSNVAHSVLSVDQYVKGIGHILQPLLITNMYEYQLRTVAWMMALEYEVYTVAIVFFELKRVY